MVLQELVRAHYGETPFDFVDTVTDFAPRTFRIQLSSTKQHTMARLLLMMIWFFNTWIQII